MRRRLADISYTVLECYLQENLAQDASWINILLALRGNLQHVPANKILSVGGSDWLSFLYVQWICMKIKTSRGTDINLEFIGTRELGLIKFYQEQLSIDNG